MPSAGKSQSAIASSAFHFATMPNTVGSRDYNEGQIEITHRFIRKIVTLRPRDCLFGAAVL
ncbi:hypothetical protein RMSM_07400 [Rhodopirellula maiorica SM1]|uniref:Uncharacterized protein n=1 Tax=Rhodopirellula maiorica SM1 TaxID=1265738 RepID=M5RNW4_9BACT|nr:hypothetical protein RMSM_07400 [Rhodopirellula maiorica SM1]